MNTGRPIGTDETSTAPSNSWNVTSTAASVGPYKFTNRTPGNATWIARAVDTGNASPEANTHRNDPTPTAASSAANTANIDGTKCATDTPSTPINSAKYTGSR
ncbi:hypothetical protein BJF84_16050 [Rhodococcus sp. CUA-806]|nr:hypothetical protein BJF84_16050 [Rhodococcus sp. CUA-806]